MVRLAVVALWLTASIAGCRDMPGAPVASVRDSAGVRIVHYPDLGELPMWTMSEEPTFAVGEVAGDSLSELYRVTYPRRRHDGQIVVPNARSELRLFGPSGRHRLTLGREGDGPGEFRGLWFVFPMPDGSVVTFDGGGRLRHFELESFEEARSWNLKQVVTFPNGLSLLGDLSAVGVQAQFPSPTRREPGTRHLFDATLVKFDSAGVLGRAIWTFPGYEFDLSTVGGRSIQYGVAPVSTSSLDRIYAGWSGAFEVRVFDSTGTLLQVIRADIPREAVPGGTDQQLLPGALPGQLGVPSDSLPAFARLLATQANELWVRKYSIPGGAQSDWIVFSAEGFAIGQVTVPREFRVTEVGYDYVLGVWTGEYDVESVRLYELVRFPS